jgi:hypothetical protein
MAMDLARFTQLCSTLARIDLFGSDPKVRPNVSTPAAIRTAIANGGPNLPLTYRQTYVAAVGTQLADVLVQIKTMPAAQRAGIIERFYGPVYEHAALTGMRDVRPELRRFLAVISNLYRSFVNANKRSSVNAPVVTATPPVAFFQTNGDDGPYTITSDTMQSLFSMPIAVVSLPATYRDHPVLWSSLTHEVCGHDVVHADKELVPQMVKGVRAMFTGTSFQPNGPLNPDLLNALLWSYWIDEAVADVYGVLNMGPTFALNLAAFFSALTARAFTRAGRTPPPLPFLRTTAEPRDPEHQDNDMDEHPVDVLRLHLAIGVIDALTHLSDATKAAYVADIQAVAHAAAHGETQIRVQGDVEISHDNWRAIDETMPLADAAAAARRVGTFLATAKLPALAGHGIQDIETWDDPDETTARAIAARIGAKQSIVGAGDDAQLLAGANIALIARPDLYDQATELLNAGLDDSFDRDPIWGPPHADRMVVPSFLHRLEAVAVGAAVPAGVRRRARS